MQTTRVTPSGVTVKITYRRPDESQAVQPQEGPREQQLRQIKRRFPRHSLVSGKGPEAECIRLAIVPTDPDFPYELPEMPVVLRVPGGYPDEPATMTVEPGALPGEFRRRIEEAFNGWMAARPAPTLLQAVNRLDRQLETLLRPERASTIKFLSPAAIDADLARLAAEELSEKPSEPAAVPQLAVSDAFGTLVRFDTFQLLNAAWARCESLALVVQCEKCGTQVLFGRVKASPSLSEWGASGAQTPAEYLALVQSDKDRHFENCSTCKNRLSVRFRGKLAHAHAAEIGHVDVSGGAAFDVAPSDFAVACEACLVEAPEPAVAAFARVPLGRLVAAACRQCHARVAMRVDTPVLLLLPSTLPSFGSEAPAAPRPTGESKGSAKAAAAAARAAAQRQRRSEERQLGVCVGQPLPGNGVCKHYSQSFRWFRFPCCGRLFACDECHLAGSPRDHEALPAHRMVCGFCGREQPCPSASARRGAVTCASCDAALNRAPPGANAFWEGGKGTRSRTLMSRNDSHKYAGQSKTVSRRRRADA